MREEVVRFAIHKFFLEPLLGFALHASQAFHF